MRRTPVVLGETTSLGGYPLGLPLKVVEMGPVTAIGTGNTFFARVDAHPGNSGSGLLDADLRLVGELTNGPVSAFVDTGSCRTLRVIGEDTTRTETLRTVTSALDALCARGYPSEALCGLVCGDGVCGAREACPADCAAEADAGAASDAAVATDDAGAPTDAGARVDAASIEPGILDAGAVTSGDRESGGGCACRVAPRRADGRAPLALVSALALSLASRRRTRRARGSRS